MGHMPAPCRHGGHLWSIEAHTSGGHVRGIGRDDAGNGGHPKAPWLDRGRRGDPDGRVHESSLRRCRAAQLHLLLRPRVHHLDHQLANRPGSDSRPTGDERPVPLAADDSGDDDHPGDHHHRHALPVRNVRRDRPPQPEDPAEQAQSGGTPSLGSAERVVFEHPATSDPAQPAEHRRPSTTRPTARPASHTQDSAALAAATSPDTTESGASLFWPVILGLCCLLLLGGPVVARRLRHPQ